MSKKSKELFKFGFAPAILMIFSTSVKAAEYQILTKPECQVSKYTNGKWTAEPATPYAGKPLTVAHTYPAGQLLLSDASGQLLVKPECAENVSSQIVATPLTKTMGKKNRIPFIVQLRGIYTFKGATPAAIGTSQSTALSPSLGFDLRDYYSWDSKNSVFVSLSKFGESQTTTDTSGWISSESDSIWAFKFGYQAKLATEGTIPYFSVAAGLAKFSRATTLTGTESGVINSSSMPLTGSLEAGMYFPFGKRLNGVIALAYTYLKSGNQTVSDSTVSDAAVGSIIPTANYSNIAIQFGLAY